jgi:hypothetical protein
MPGPVFGGELLMDIATQQLRRSPGVLAQRVKPEEPTTVLLDPQSGQYYTLDEVGSRVWELCDGSRKVAEIVDIIGQEYDAPADVIQADVIELLRDLTDEKLVVAHP